VVSHSNLETERRDGMREILRSNKNLALTMAVLLLAWVGLFLGSSQLTATFTEADCIDDWCAFAATVEGVGEVQGELNGSTSVEVQPSKIGKGGLRTTPLMVKAN